MEIRRARSLIDGHSTSKGCNDRVPLSPSHARHQQFAALAMIVQVDGVTLSVFTPGEDLGNPKPLRKTPTTPVRHYGFQRSYQHSE